MGNCCFRPEGYSYHHPDGLQPARMARGKKHPKRQPTESWVILGHTLEIKEPDDIKLGFVSRQVDGEWVTYSVWRMVQLLRDRPVKRIPVSRLDHNLDIDLWDDDQGRPITPRSVLTMYSAQHPDPWGNWGRIVHASLEYPLLVVHKPDGSLDVLDGLHRLCKAEIHHLTTVRVKFVTANVLRKAKLSVVATPPGLEPRHATNHARPLEYPSPVPFEWMKAFPPRDYIIQRRGDNEWFVQRHNGAALDDLGTLYADDGRVVQRFSWIPDRK